MNLASITFKYDSSAPVIESDTILLRNVYRPLFWLIDIQQNSQSKFLLLVRSSVCKFPITANCKKSRKCRQNKKIIGYDISCRHKHSTLHDCQLEGSGIAHGCSFWAETEWKLKTRRGCHVPKYAACLNPFSFQVVSGNILFAFVTDFLRKKNLGQLREIYLQFHSLEWRYK